ncbi:hypothetical protein F183_A31670 [Bryobacterales bacterium F-183]|nr:hypothetical protein F183_A31670 [Bryobacterales bacterium F-183]
MFDTHLKSTGTDYTARATLLIAAFVIIPFLMLMSGPLTNVVLATGIAASVACIGLAWLNIRRYSKVAIPTLENARTVVK